MTTTRQPHRNRFSNSPRLRRTAGNFATYRARWLGIGCLAWLCASPAVRGAGLDLFSVPPPSIESSNGILNADLVMKYADLTINGRLIHMRTYNGRIPGPTLRAHPGETLRIRYINRLPPNPPMPHEAWADGYIPPHEFNTINLHTHGLNVSPERNSDNVLLLINPGYWVPFEVRIPANHPTGLFWYHPHKHGATASHLGSAMTGNIILTGSGDLDQIREIAAARKLEMIFNEIPLAPVGSHFEVPDQPLDTVFAGMRIFTVNGIPVHEEVTSTNLPPVREPVLPEIHIRPGEVQRWQFTHAGIEQFVTLTVMDEKTGAAWPLHLIAYDAITLPAVDSANSIFLGAGNRAEFLVKGGDPGEYLFKSLKNDEQFGSEDIPLAKVIVEGAPAQMALPAALNPPLARLPDIKDNEIIRHRVISFDVKPVSDERILTFQVNNKFFNGDRVDQTMLLNTAEEWTLTTDMMMSHPFHIHVNWFQVTHINGVPLPRPRWQDTIVIPKGGNVTIRHRFQQWTGKFVLHCHILAHEDLGMMALLDVIDPQNLTPLENWRQQQFGRPINQFDGADVADPDGDGFPNLVHYALGLRPYFQMDPNVPLPTPVIAKDGNQNYPAIRFGRLSAPNSGVKYFLQRSTSLLDWTNVNAQLVGNPVDNGNGFETVVVRDETPVSGPGTDSARFLRIRVAADEFEPLPITPDLPQ